MPIEHHKNAILGLGIREALTTWGIDILTQAQELALNAGYTVTVIG